MGNPWRFTGSMGIKPLIALKGLKIDDNEGKNVDEDDVNIEDFDSKDEENNGMFNDAQMKTVALKEWY